MDSEKDFDYTAEYAKSNRSKCKGCQSLISKDSLRIALMVQSFHHDGKDPQWYHYSCFFKKCRPASVDDIKDFYNLRGTDQEKIRVQIESFATAGATKSGKKGPKLISTTLKDFIVQYASSNRSTCRGCEQKIEKEEIRISHKEKHPEKPQLGLVDRWHHVGCFLKKREEMGWQDHFTAEMLTGFSGIDKNDKEQLKGLFVSKAKKSKKAKKQIDDASSSGNFEDEKIKKKIKEQSNLMWKNIDKIKAQSYTSATLEDMLLLNDQVVPTGINERLLAIGDGMTFGALPKCQECKDGRLKFNTNHYCCTGQISEWTRCSYTTREVKRSPWRFPDDFDELKYTYKKRDRVLPTMAPVLPLKDKKVCVVGKTSLSKSDLKSVVEKLGGTITTSVSRAYFCITNKDEVQKMGKKMSDLQVQDVFVVSEEILDSVKDLTSTQPLLPFLKKYSIADWGKEQHIRSSGKRVMEEVPEVTEAKKIKIVAKSGVVVDPDSGLDSTCHVLVKHGTKYTATLSQVDMRKGSNSYYKLQLLKEDQKQHWYVFRAWGRVGTSIGGNKVENFFSEESAIQDFKHHYLEKTGNHFGMKFEKVPNKFYPLDIVHGDDENAKKGKTIQEAGFDSKLDKAVQKLIKMIFDIEMMKRAMVEFEIDLNKMPLGKLSKQQMQKAYEVLTEANDLIDKGVLIGPKILDCSNRFYTLIPHNFGMKQPPLLDNLDIVKSKVEMLDSLMDIEVAYNLLQEESNAGDVDPLDAHYKKLKCDIEPIPKDSDTYKMIQTMVKNTHAPTHSSYDLEVEEVFKIERKEEASRYRPFKNLHNRQLLWHGSRMTNFAGILSQGLRIAPPEAPATGYMFGKGLYFADMVSKSANYCYINHMNPTGLLLLAEVALGNMYELKGAKNVCKLPKGKHSVKGVGSTSPNDKDAITLPDGTIVQTGVGVDANVDKASLLYNEYIVYDVAQVHLNYMVQLKFNLHTRW